MGLTGRDAVAGVCALRLAPSYVGAQSKIRTEITTTCLGKVFVNIVVLQQTVELIIKQCDKTV